MNSKQRGRRRLLKGGAALAGLAVGALRSASGQTLEFETPELRPRDTRAYGERSRFETSRRPGTPLQDLMGIITPSSLHFVVPGGDPPDIDPRQHRLLIHGMVDRPLIFTLEELKRLPSVSRIYFLECNANSRPFTQMKNATVQRIHGLTACSEWAGVPLSLLLREVGVKKAASWLLVEGLEPGPGKDKRKSIPLEKAMDDILVAYGQNGEALRPDQGYPLRLVVPGWEAVNSTKWLRQIKVVDQPYMTKTESPGHTFLRPDGKARWFNFELGPKSLITFPSPGHRLPSRGFYEIAGLAWSGRGAIRRVEVSTDGGRTWEDAQLQEPALRFAHTRFRRPWNWDGEATILQSRCTDEQGQVQPTLAELNKIWGVNSEFWQATTTVVGHFNAIQLWEVTRDGSVHNALFS